MGEIVELRRRAAELADHYLSMLPTPWNADEFCSAAGAAAGLTITVTNTTGRPMPTGFALRRGDHGLIVVRSDLTGPHRDHVILHELCHLLCGHGTAATTALTPNGSGAPSLPTYSDPEELLAEMFATHVLAHAANPAPNHARITALFAG